MRKRAGSSQWRMGRNMKPELHEDSSPTIKDLEAKILERDAVIAVVVNELMALRAHLCSDKFTGLDLDGARKDWISTKDVDTRLLDIISNIFKVI